ncbi:MAG: UDP-N-acetylmuramoyl-tripeptide--D-alanyl-D-alanine ligase [Chloroflexi bacterium]|nr:UDP-N-acetylmuramoyl-tripeptide--D-alanyl-D-alanine ligase [Chloroflexota bacterium]
MWQSWSQTLFSTVVSDSRQVEPGCLFVALKGERADGHDYIDQALAGGAVAVLAAAAEYTIGGGARTPQTRWLNVPTGARSDGAVRTGSGKTWLLLVPDPLIALQEIAIYWRQQHAQIRVVGITGSVGKTTTKELTAAVVSSRYKTFKSPGNLNSEVGLPLALLKLEHQHQRAILEMGMYDIGEIERLAAIARPQIGIVTNVGTAHLQRLGTVERIQQAKSELVRALPADGVAVLNADDHRVLEMRRWTPARVFTYGFSPDADLRAEEMESNGLEGISLWFHPKGGERIFGRLPLMGRHSAHGVLAAAAVGLIEGLSWDEIIGGLKSLPGQLRLVMAPAINGAHVIDDTYNAGPDSSVAALNLLQELTGRRIAVLGDMLELGPYETQAHQIVGARAAEVVDLLLVTGARGRLIGEAALAAGLQLNQVFFAAGNQEAASLLKQLLQPGDIVLIKGSRGVHMEDIVQEIDLVEIDLVEREV